MINIFTSARDLTRTFERAHAIARAIANTNDLAFALTRDFNRNLALDLVTNHASRLDRNLALALASTLDRDLAPALALAFAPDIDRDFISVSISDLDHANSLNLASVSALVSTHTHDRAFALADALTDNIILCANDRSRTIPLKIKNKMDSVQIKETKETRLRRRLHVRWSALTLALVLKGEFLNKNSSQTRAARLLNHTKNQSREDEVIQQAYENLLSLYSDFALLELPVQGQLPAWEGILLVKERKIVTDR